MKKYPFPVIEITASFMTNALFPITYGHGFGKYPLPVVRITTFSVGNPFPVIKKVKYFVRNPVFRFTNSDGFAAPTAFWTSFQQNRTEYVVGGINKWPSIPFRHPPIILCDLNTV